MRAVAAISSSNRYAEASIFGSGVSRFYPFASCECEGGNLEALDCDFAIDVLVVTLLWRPSELPERGFGVPAGADSRMLPTLRSILALNGAHEDPSPDESRPIPVAVDAGESIRILSGGNLGYGGGNNAAVEWSRHCFSPRYFLFLNPDVEIDTNAIFALVKQADLEPEVAVLGPVQMVSAGGTCKVRRGLRYLRWLSVIRDVSRSVARIDYINGGALLVRAEALRGELPFTNEFFLFFEELELCDRMRRRGYRIAVCEESQVTHYEGGVRSSRRDPDYCPEVSEYFENLNALRFTKKYCPWALPSVLLVRLLLKPIVLLVRRDRIRFGFWWMAVKDFSLRRVSRFPFQQGWNPRLSGESLRDALWPEFASKADLRTVDT